VNRDGFLNMAANERDRRIVEYEAKLPPLQPGVLLYSRISSAARATNYWIVVRKTNKESLGYVGNPSYVPKGISCKAKTAKLSPMVQVDGQWVFARCAGLVADPTVVAAAFSQATQSDVLQLWQRFAREHMGPAAGLGYEVDLRATSRHYGCLMRNKKWIHGDLDLFDVIKPGSQSLDRARSEVLDGARNLYSEATRIVGNKLNMLLGENMVQHGAQAHYGGFDSEALDVFAPDGRMFELPNRTFARGWYLLRWPGRFPAAGL
jgi:hypothetical protein